MSDEETNLRGWKDGVLCSVLGEMLHVLPVVSQEVRLHWGVEGRPQGNNVSAACRLSWFCITREGVWGKNWSVLQAEMKAITNSGSSIGKWCGNFSSEIIFNQGARTHMQA